MLIQHEYGIFGGTDGSHLLESTRALNACGIPYLLTLHTVLSRPSSGQAATLRALCARAARVTVFTETARRVAIRTGVAAGHQLVGGPARRARRDAAAAGPGDAAHRPARAARDGRGQADTHHVRPAQ